MRRCTSTRLREYKISTYVVHRSTRHIFAYTVKCTNFRSYHERWIITCIKYSYIRYIRDSRFTSNLARLKCGISWGQLFSEKMLDFTDFFHELKPESAQSQTSHRAESTINAGKPCAESEWAPIYKNIAESVYTLTVWVVLLARAIYSYKFTTVKWRFITCSYYLFVKGTFSKKMSARKIFFILNNLFNF